MERLLDKSDDSRLWREHRFLHSAGVAGLYKRRDLEATKVVKRNFCIDVM